MTQAEREAVLTAVQRIRYLTDVDNHAGFDLDKKTDAYIKDEIRPYMEWFDAVADMLENLAIAVEKEDRKQAVMEIFRHCY